MATLLSAAASAGALAGTAPDPSLVLDERAYFRQHLVFGLERISARPLKEEAEKLFPKDSRGRGGLEALERTTKKLLEGRGIDWEKTDWRDVAAYHFSRTQCGTDERGAMMIPADWPPEVWGAADFDDSGWTWQRLGRLSHTRLGATAYDFNTLMIRGAFFRTAFLVPDPAAAGELTLKVSFRGGARVLVNGQEIARAHLPAGALGAESHADDYPLDAYIALDDEIPAGRKYQDGLGDLRVAWEEAPVHTRKEGAEYRRNGAYNDQCLTEKGWRRVQTLRDRVIGPLKVPPNLLRKGVNVLAIEVRTNHYHPFILPTGGVRRWGAHGGYENYTWDHCRLLRLELRGQEGKLPSMLSRPPGVQAWAADMHCRVYTPDYHPAGLPSGVLRLVGARNGTYCGQVVIGTDRELTGLKATCGDLLGANGAKIPASAVQVLPMQGQPIWVLEFLGHDRSLDLRFDPKNPHLTATGEVAAVRYRIYEGLPSKPRHEIAPKVMEVYDRFKFFDHISAAWPEKVPADTCQSLWVYLRVPSEAAPGTYRGTITVSAEGVEPMAVPLEAEVASWRVPDPLAFQTLVESEQSPYAIAKHYAVPLWSEEHFKLMEPSFRQLARLGADWLFVPVLLNSELGNREDSPIRWIRDKRGELRFDFATMDRYVDLAAKHWGVPRVICFLVMHGVSAPSNQVKLRDEATGKEELVDVGPGQDAAVRRPIWQVFATALLEHMKARGMERSVYWGHVFDNLADPELITILREFAPQVHWAAGAHARQPDETFRATARAYGSDILDRSSCGWKNPFIHLLMPRAYGSVICVEGTSTPFTHRVMCDRAIYAGFNGIGRMGADYFDTTWFDGFKGREWYLVGRSCVQTLWPGKVGAESSARHETMLEGIQEAEARIFLEQCLERNILKGGLEQQARETLDRHVRETLYIPGGACGIDLMDYTGDWQARSRRLYDAAARAAEQVGLDVNVMALGAVEMKSSFQGREQKVFTGDGITVPASGKAMARVVLRNWTSRPRAWRAAGSDPWLRPEKPAGQAPPGQQELTVVLDGSGLKAGETVVGTLTVADVASGTEYPVKVTAKVGKPVELLAERPVLNVVAGQPDSLTFKLVNNTDGEQRFQFASGERWLKVEPASGKLAAGKAAFVKFTAGPVKLPPGSAEVEVTLTAAGGAVTEKLAFRVYSVAEYQPPRAAPAGEAVLLDSLPWAKYGKAHESGSKKGEGPRMGLREDGKRKLAIGEKTYEHGLWVNPAHRTAYNIEGAGFEAFSAEVGVAAEVTKNIERYGAARGQQVCFEVYVDGVCRAQSGLMKATDGPRTLVVDGLRSAKEIVLSTRTRGGADAAILCHWAEAKFYKPKGSNP